MQEPYTSQLYFTFGQVSRNFIVAFSLLLHFGKLFSGLQEIPHRSPL